MSNLLEKASIITTPTAYSDGVLHSVKPSESPYADFTFTRNNPGTRVNSSGNIESIAGDLPRIDYLGGSGSWLLEPEATNTATDSNDFTTGEIFVSSSNPLLLNSLTLTANATTSPEGLTNASKIQIGTTNSGINRVRYSSVNIVSGNVNVISVFAKKGSGVDWFALFADSFDVGTRAWFDLENGVVGTASSGVLDSKIEDYGNGWYRCSMSFSSVDNVGVVSLVITNADNNAPYSGDLTDHHFIYGLQCESHATRQYATSYIPTSGSTVTRGADLATDAGSSDLISSTEGVFYLKVAASTSINNFESITLSDGSTQNRIRFQLLNTLNRAAFQVQVGGVSQMFKAIDTTDITNFNKIAIKYKQNDFSVWLNGVKIHTDTSGTIPTLSELNFTSGVVSGNFNGKVKCVAVFEEALTDAELTCLTTI